MPKILQNHYVLAVADARASADWYINALGFKLVDEPPGWVFVRRDNCMIMIGSCPDQMHPGKLGDHNYFAYLRVDDVDRYHNEIQARGVEGLSELTNKPWGMREFGVTSPDGHRLMIGQSLSE